MKLSIVQFKPEYAASEMNLKMMTDYINCISSDIIVFPELATSGYFFLNKEDIGLLAFPFNGKEIQKFQQLATNQEKILVFGFPEDVHGIYYNSAAVLFPEPNLSRVYRKTHLFYKERIIFDKGNSGFFVVNYPKWDINIGTMICYDWRFPEAARSLALQNADIIICPSNLVTKIWHLSMPSRALENKVYLAVANRVGKEKLQDEELHFNGESGIWKYNGELLIKASKEDEDVITCDIYPEETRNKKFNEFNDIFLDRRPEMYKM